MYSFLRTTDRPLCERWLLATSVAFEGGRAKTLHRWLGERGKNRREMV
jgi:hypothetical protein